METSGIDTKSFLNRRSVNPKLLAGVLFFISGVTGLAYEVIWFKRFGVVWGSSSFAMATVVACFLGGLGLGAWIAGRLVSPIRNSLFIYGVLELGIAFTAFLIPYEIQFLRGPVSSLLPGPEASVIVWFLLRVALTFVVLGPPCMMMGATLPVLVMAWPTETNRIRNATPVLYAFNTAGAAIGCVLAGFILLPVFGLMATNLGLVFVNAAIGAIAITVAHRMASVAADSSSSVTVESSTSSSSTDNEIRLLCNYSVAGLTGFCALVLQMTWSRQLSVTLGSSTYGFTSTVFVMLVGIGLGSWLFYAWARMMRPSVYGLATVIIVLNMGVATGTHLIPSLCETAGLAQSLRTRIIPNAVFCMVIAGALELLSAICMGILFPMLVGLAEVTSRSPARQVGNVYAANTIGSVIGALVAAEILFPMIGTYWTLKMVIIVYFIAAFLMLPMSCRRDFISVGAITFLTFATLIYAKSAEDPRKTNGGAFLYGPGVATQNKLLFFNEGKACNVMVTESLVDGNRSLFVNGKVDASSTQDMAMQLGLAYLPRFVHPDAADVCVIGFGSGTTAGAAVQFPKTRVICCELEPSIVDASTHFTHVNHEPTKFPEFRIVHDDARNYLQRTSETFDLILSEPSNPWIAGVSGLFTQEFYASIRPRLNEGGILAQWIQAYSLSVKEYSLILRTVTRSFPNCVLLRVSAADTILLASDSEIRINAEFLRRAQEHVDSLPVVKADLEKYFSTSDVRSLILTTCTHDSAAILKFIDESGVSTINTDINMRLEYDAPTQLFRSTGADISTALIASESPTLGVTLWNSLNCSAEQAKALKGVIDRKLTTARDLNWKRDVCLPLVQCGELTVPNDPYFHAARILLTRSKPDSADLRGQMKKLGEVSEETLASLGYRLWSNEMFEEAVMAYEILSEKNPYSATTMANLALNLAQAGHIEESRITLEKLRKLDSMCTLLEPAEEAVKKAEDAARAKSQIDITTKDLSQKNADETPDTTHDKASEGQSDR